MGLALDRYVRYSFNAKIFAASLVLSLATYAIYLRYFDILAPFIPQGSVRDNSGLVFALPVFLLLGGQTLFGMYFTHVAVTLATPEKRDALKAYLVASFQILLFSLYYVIFPFYGPYTYIVYFMPGQNFGSFAYPLLVAWTLVIIIATYLLTTRTFKLEGSFGTKKRLLLAAGVLAMVMAMAS